MSVEDTLATTPLFSELSRKDLKRLASAAIARSYKKGAVIVKEGENAVAFYIVMSGRVEVVKEMGSKKEKRLATLGAGDFFGDMALLEPFPRSASVRAAENTDCLVLTRWDFLAELRANPYIAVQMLPVLSRRLREAQEGTAAQA